MSVPVLKPAFVHGEVAPAMYGRFDLPIMATAASTMRNMYVGYRGGAYSRAGTAFVGFSKQTGRSYPPRLIDFQFNINQGLCLEFGNFYLRVISDGAFVTESPIAISNITQANPGVLTIAAFSVTGATPNNASVSASYVANDTVTIAGGTSTVPAVLTVENTGLASISVNSSGIASVATGYVGYVPGDTISLAGGTFMTPAVLTVATTLVNGAAIFNAGSGGSPGAATVTGTGGTGTKFQASVTIGGGGSITHINSITVAGDYTVNPPFNAFPFDQYVEQVTGGGLVGAEFTLSMGVRSVSILNPGSFTQNAIGGTFTQNSTSGGGQGATFNTALFGPNQLSVTNGGIYSVLPSNPASQASTSGSGSGATFNLSSGAAASLNTGDWVYLQGIGGMIELNGETVVLTELTSTTYSMHDVYGNNINTSGFPAYTSGGTASRIYTLTTPYAEQDLEWLKVVQSADVMSICCLNQQTLTEYQPQDLERISDTDFTFTPVVAAPTVSPPTGVSGSASASGSVDYQYEITAVNPADGTESIASAIISINSAVDVATTAGTITLTWGIEQGINEYNIYKAEPGYTVTPPVGALFGYAGTAYGTQFIDSNVVQDFSQVPPTHQDPFSRGQILGAFPLKGGSGYTQGTAGYTINTSTGSGAVLELIVIGGSVVGFIVIEPGQNYAPDDTITITGQGTGTGATATFTGSATDGAIETVTVTAGGSSYVDPMVTAPGGTGAVFVPVVVGGVITQIYWTNSGIGYGTSGALTITDSAPAGTGATAALQIGPQSGTYPSVPAYFQERRCYANTINQPDTYFMSQPGSFTNFDFRTPTIDSDAITGSPWAVEVNGIQWMIQAPAGLLVLTGLSAWLLVGTGSFATNVQAISPSSQVANPQPFSGCSATLPPIKINYDVIYVDAKNSFYLDLPYQLYALSEPIDLTQFSSHLFIGYTFIQHAWTQQINKLLWTIRDDGTMLSLTYLKSQEVAGWGRHDTQGLFESCCSVTEPPVDALYVATQRFPGTNTAYMIERMNNRIWENVEDAWCVDCGLSYPQPAPNATLTASSATGLGSCTGITNLVGGQNYSAATTATVIDAPMTPNQAPGPGSGAVAALTIAGGAITGVSFSPAGSAYLNPQLSINDPENSGSGASAKITLNNTMTFTASAAVFSLGNVGSVIRAGGGIATITAYTDTEHVTANMLSPIVDVFTDGATSLPVPQAAGSWTMTAPITTVSGLNHLIGATVTGLADGNVIAPQTVSAAGTITLGTAASAVTVGLGFQAQLQSVYLDAGSPTVQGQRNKIAEVVLRIENSRGLKVGTSQPDGSTLSPIAVAPPWYVGPGGLTTVPDDGPNFPKKPYNALAIPLRTGDINCPSGGGFNMRSQIAIQQDFPLPMEILAIIPSILPGDSPQTQAPKHQQGRG